MPLLNYTTAIDPDKTASEIARILSKHGAKAVLTEYDKEEGYVSALSFKVEVNGNDIAFRLPSDWKPVLIILKNDPKVRRSDATEAQAIRTAWRIIKDWVEAQMALVETQMVKTEQVFLPYAVTNNGQTLYEKISETGFLLGEGKSQ